ERTAPEPRDQARLASATQAQNRDEARPRVQTSGEFGQWLATADEGIALGRQAVTRERRQRRKIGTQVRRDDLKQALGVEQTLQLMLAHFAQRDAFGQLSAGHFCRGGGGRDL